MGQEGFNGLIFYQFGQNLAKIGWLVDIIGWPGKHGSKESDEHNRTIQPIARFSQSRDSANRAIQRHILMHRAYPLPLEKPSSLTLSCGLGFGFGWMVLAYSLDHFVTFQGISLDFWYLVRGRRRSETKNFFASETLRACESKKSRTKFVI